jgi:hypothetical protein
MKCFLCEKDVNLHSVALLGGEIRMHLDCFFKDIPNPTSKMDKDYTEKDARRTQLIDEKTQRIIEEYQQSRV